MNTKLGIFATAVIVSWAAADTTFTIAQQTGYREYEVKMAYYWRTGVLPADVFRKISFWNGASLSENNYDPSPTIPEAHIAYSGFVLNQAGTQDTVFIKADTAIHFYSSWEQGNRDTSWKNATSLPAPRQSADWTTDGGFSPPLKKYYGTGLWYLDGGGLNGTTPLWRYQQILFKSGYRGILYVKLSNGPAMKIQVIAVNYIDSTYHVADAQYAPWQTPLDYTLRIGIDFSGQGKLEGSSAIQRNSAKIRTSSFTLFKDGRVLDMRGRLLPVSNSPNSRTAPFRNPSIP